jgi:allantoicase
VSDWTQLPDLALRTLGGAVIAASDEFFGDKENLIKSEAPVFTPFTFGLRGQVYDGWETRRLRGQGLHGEGHDWAVVRLGLPGVPHLVVVDTAHFTGNFPARCSVEATALDGYPSPAEVLDAQWVPLVEPTGLQGNASHELDVAVRQRFTHVRLSIYPDGGVARLRVHGRPLPDPRELDLMPLDLAAMANGGRTVRCSNSFFSRADNMLRSGESRFMADGWETARRRDGGNDWAVVELACQGEPAVVEIATTHYKGNAPSHAALSGLDAGSADFDDAQAWVPLLERTRLQPDTTHRFRLAEDMPPVTHVRLDIYPDGGVARLRVFGRLTAPGRRELTLRWLNALPAAQASGLLPAELVARRPLAELPPELVIR